MDFLRCVCYYAMVGIASFFVGRLVSRHRFRYDAVPFRPFPFEKEGRIYKKIGIARWQGKVPDMSRILKGLMPPKALAGRPDRETLLVMVQETCVAELVHWLLCLAGLASLWLWPGAGGLLCWLLYCLVGNLPFILIQRYNRPRLLKLLERQSRGEGEKK